MLRALIVKTARLAAVATALVALGAPLAGSTLPQEPITVTGVHSVIESTENYKPSFLVIDFRNESSQPAKAVLFHVTDPAGNQMTIDDAGTFSPGVAIHHAFMVRGWRDSKVEVVEVRFADGSYWERHYAPPTRPQAI